MNRKSSGPSCSGFAVPKQKAALTAQIRLCYKGGFLHGATLLFHCLHFKTKRDKYLSPTLCKDIGCPCYGGIRTSTHAEVTLPINYAHGDPARTPGHPPAGGPRNRIKGFIYPQCTARFWIVKMRWGKEEGSHRESLQRHPTLVLGGREQNPTSRLTARDVLDDLLDTFAGDLTSTRRRFSEYQQREIVSFDGSATIQ